MAQSGLELSRATGSIARRSSAGDGSGRIFVVEQGGTDPPRRRRQLVEQPFLDISDRITSGGERGLLGLAFHPDFPDDPRFFVDYTDHQGDTVISSFTVARRRTSADPETERILLHDRAAVRQPQRRRGRLRAGRDALHRDGRRRLRRRPAGQRPAPRHAPRQDPADRRRRAGRAGRAPTPSRPTTRSSTPAGALPEIWLTGLRNPWRMRFDRATGDLWIGDVGQGAWEEIDVARAGQAG